MAQELAPRYWPAEAKKVIDEVAASVGRAAADARARLEANGARKGFEQGSFCFECQCENFEARMPLGLTMGGGDHPATPCLRLGCGHAFLRHYVY